MQELETALAEEQLRRQEAGDLLPSNIDARGATVSFCREKNDICEETLSGLDTTHCTNGIAIRVTAGPSLPSATAPQIVRRPHHRRSVFVPPGTVLEYNACIRCGPPAMELPANAMR